jgi:hypothetical protein
MYAFADATAPETQDKRDKPKIFEILFPLTHHSALSRLLLSPLSIDERERGQAAEDKQTRFGGHPQKFFERLISRFFSIFSFLEIYFSS